MSTDWQGWSFESVHILQKDSELHCVETWGTISDGKRRAEAGKTLFSCRMARLRRA